MPPTACRPAKSRLISWTALLALLIGLNACSAGGWQQAAGRIESGRWSIQAPQGWMRLSTPDFEMLTKDGPYLEYIYLQERPLGEKFLYTQQHIEAGMLPNEMAQVVIDNLRADSQIGDFTLLENAPATVAGHPGFRLVFTYTDKNGLSMRSIYYGTVNSAQFFHMRYTAAQRHYFAADLKNFEEVFKSLRLQ